MQFVMSILVFAKDSEDALVKAHNVIDKMTFGVFENRMDFVDFTKDGYLNKDGVRLNPPVLQVSTKRFPTNDKRGLEMANSAMEDNRRTFMRNMRMIRYHITNYTDEQLFEAKGWLDGVQHPRNPCWFRMYCGMVSLMYVQDPCVYLYDYRGYGVTYPEYLQGILNDSDENPFYIESDGRDPNDGSLILNQPLWIVPFEVHY